MDIYTRYPCHPSNYQRGRAQPVSYLVYHYVGAAGGAEANARYYHNTPGIGASAHYFVDHTPGAQVWQSVAEGDTAWHCGRSDGQYRHPACRNANSIGIEMCCHQRADGSWYIDEATMAAAAELGRDIMARYGIPLENVVRHYDVTGKLCPRPLVNETAWAEFKKRLGVEKVTQEQFNAMMETYLNQQREKETSTWSAAAWEKAKNAGVFDGTAPQAPLSREQAALVLDRLGLLGK